MKVLFLIAIFVPMILTVHAQRQFSHYTCSVAHKHHDTNFYMDLGDRKEVEIGGWKVIAGIKRAGNAVNVSLARIVSVMDATYQKEEKKSFALSARILPVELVHTFGGKSDTFKMVCYPRDP
jgi:hypothetical protein